MLRELWRTFCLMRFASRIYRDDAGSIYLIEHDRWSRLPSHIDKVPDIQTLELLMRETCWSATHLFLAALTGVAIMAIVLVSGSHLGWVFLVLAPLLVMSVIGNRGRDLVLQRCTKVATKDSALVLTPTSELANLKLLTLVSFCAALSIFAPFTVFALSEHMVPAPAEQISGLAIGATILVATPAVRLILAAGRVLNRHHLDLAFENRK